MCLLALAEAKHQALVESPLCEIRFAEMMTLGNPTSEGTLAARISACQ